MSDKKQSPTHFQDIFNEIPFDPEDPSTSQALYLDWSTPIDPEVKAALLYGLDSKSRQFFLPIIRPFSRLLIIAIQVLKVFFPRIFRSSKTLHYLIYLGLKYFASREANLLIMRHFHIGSEILQFIKDNIEGLDIPMRPLKPYTIDEVKDDLFVNHDVNLFNFVIRVNKAISEEGVEIKPVKELNFDAITDGPFEMADFRDNWYNVIDCETAIEVYTPIFQFFLSDKEFWRASNSLQLDEVIGVYISKIIGTGEHLWRVNNRHPLVPLTTLKAGYRLLLHGLSSESIHYLLRMEKRKQK